jgi:signal transduction histidine kinase
MKSVAVQISGVRASQRRRRERPTLTLVRAGAPDAENLRLLGSMTAGVAHDLRNVLNGLSLHVQVLERSKGQDASDSLAHLRSAVTTGVELVNQLVGFGSAHAQPRAEVQLGMLAHEACALSRMHKRPVGLAAIVLREAHEPSASVMAYRGDVLSAVLNLVLNAIDSMPSGGTVDVATGSARGGVWVRVSDEGPGIPAALQRRIFEPFFTTKGANGNGLGLSQVSECARRHGGTLDLETRAAKGATFALWLPVHKSTDGSA